MGTPPSSQLSHIGVFQGSGGQAETAGSHDTTVDRQEEIPRGQLLCFVQEIERVPLEDV